ncbi:hypothetical protein [Streptosporangium amethystogenes]|uniref:hypothetical protein n=1 Tax=Streptosporangium amethystogenes TaxID=2002 RepID=UPI0004C7B58E|nr:hypothetical protein [Streptosporangium amethystogenes]
MALAGTLPPVALAIITFGLGLSPTISDFRRVTAVVLIPVAVGMEIGIHNATPPIAAALSLLNSPQMAIPAAAYGVLMFFTAAGAGFLLRSRTTEPMPLERSSA